MRAAARRKKKHPHNSKENMLRDARWVKHRVAVERWKSNNYTIYLAQKRRLAARPEYLAHRRAMYRLRHPVRPGNEPKDLSTRENLNELEETNERTDQHLHHKRSATEGTPVWDRSRVAQWAPEEGAGEPGGSADTGGRLLL